MTNSNKPTQIIDSLEGAEISVTAIIEAIHSCVNTVQLDGIESMLYTFKERFPTAISTEEYLRKLLNMKWQKLTP